MVQSGWINKLICVVAIKIPITEIFVIVFAIEVSLEARVTPEKLLSFDFIDNNSLSEDFDVTPKL